MKHTTRSNKWRRLSRQATMPAIFQNTKGGKINSKWTAVELVLACAQTQTNAVADARVSYLLQQWGGDWEEVIQIARNHGVVPLVYRAIRDKSEALVPVEVMRVLRKDFHTIGLLIQLQIRALKEVVAVLEANDISHLFFKGLPLGCEAYGNAIWRKPGDLDVLVRINDYERVRDLLIGMGYKMDVTVQEEEAYFKRQHQMTFRGEHCDVDVHCTLQQRSFFKKPYAAPFDSEAIWQRTRTVQVGGAPIPCLSPEDLFCLLCVHGAKHGWFRLYLVTDIAAFLAAVPLDWAKVMTLGKRLKATRLIHLGVHLARQLYDISLPASIERSIQQDGVLEKLSVRIKERLFNDPGHDKPMQFHGIQLGLFKRWPEKLSYLFLVSIQHFKRKRQERDQFLSGEAS